MDDINNEIENAIPNRPLVYNYKYCSVPCCESTSKQNPEKLFLRVPFDSNRRKMWYSKARLTKATSSYASMYFCEDHFDIEESVENLTQVKLLPNSFNVIVKKSAMPTKFECQDKKYIDYVPEVKTEIIEIDDKSVLTNSENYKAKCSTSLPVNKNSTEADCNTAIKTENVEIDDVDDKVVLDSLVIDCSTDRNDDHVENSSPLLSNSECPQPVNRSNNTRKCPPPGAPIKPNRGTSVALTNPQIFPCSECEKCFRTRESLSTHYNGHFRSSMSTVACQYRGCAKSRSNTPHLQMHTFPKKEEYWQKWIIHCGRDNRRILPSHEPERIIVLGLSPSRYVGLSIGELIKEEKVDAIEEVNALDRIVTVKVEPEEYDAPFKSDEGLNTTMSVNEEHIFDAEESVVDVFLETNTRTSQKNLQLGPTEDDYTHEDGDAGTSSNLMDVKLAPQGFKTYQCGYCERIFSRAGNLKKHMRIHTGIKPYHCDFCEKRFSEKCYLQVHLRVHTGDKPHQCGICGKRFAMKSRLETHLQVHMSERNYQCKFCKKSFAQYIKMQIHLRTHTGKELHTCAFCEKLFIDKKKFETHLRIHTGEKPYQCTFCEKRFTENSKLQRHLRVHTGERPYHCTLCDKRFAENGTLQRHLVRLHSSVK